MSIWLRWFCFLFLLFFFFDDYGTCQNNVEIKTWPFVTNRNQLKWWWNMKTLLKTLTLVKTLNKVLIALLICRWFKTIYINNHYYLPFFLLFFLQFTQLFFYLPSHSLLSTLMKHLWLFFFIIIKELSLGHKYPLGINN